MKIYFLLFTLTTLTLGSDNLSLSSNHLLGKWDLNTISLKMVDANGVTIQEVADQSAKGQIMMQFDFKEGNRVAYYGKETFINQDEPTQETGTYELKENKLTININDEPMTFTLVFNDENNLHLEASETMDFQDKKISQKILYKFIRPNE